MGGSYSWNVDADLTFDPEKPEFLIYRGGNDTPSWKEMTMNVCIIRLFMND